MKTDHPSEEDNLHQDLSGTPPIDVMLATPTLLIGGAEKFVTELAVRFDPTRFRVTVLVTRGQAEPTQAQALQDAGIEILSVGGRSRVHSILACAMVLARRRPNVVHTNIGSLLHVSLGVLLLPRSVVRLHTLHSMAGHAEPGARLDITRRIIHALKFVPISISRAVRESASAAFKLPESRIPLIPNGVDTQRFSPPAQTDRPSSGVTRFVAVGSLLPVKRHDDLIIAFSNMDRQLQSSSTLTIVGGGPLHSELEALIKEKGLEQHVTLLGNQDDIPAILREHDVFVSGSRTEGFPLSLLEGLAAGLPVAVTAVDGVMDIVRDGVEGLLVPSGNTDVMTQSMEKLAGDENLRLELGRNSRQRAALFSWERCVDSYGALYAGMKHDG